MLKVFLDGAERAAMLEMAQDPDIHGFTTNPSLMKKAGVKDYEGYCKDLLPQLNGKPVSFEVFADDPAEMKRQGLKIAAWEKPGGSAVYVKIPITNALGASTLPLIRELAHSGVKINVTAIYTEAQIRGTCDALKGGAASIVSVFAGRIADSGRDPIPLMTAGAMRCAQAGDQVELLWASTREAYNIVQAREAGCRIITAPLDIVKKAKAFGKKSLEEISLETVQAFKKDADSAGFQL